MPHYDSVIAGVALICYMSTRYDVGYVVVVQRDIQRDVVVRYTSVIILRDERDT